MLRLYNHVYADPVYWNNLGVEDRIFQLASAIAVVEPDAVFCGSTAALFYGIGSVYTLLDKVQVLLPRSTGVIRMSSLNTSAGGRAKCGG